MYSEDIICSIPKTILMLPILCGVPQTPVQAFDVFYTLLMRDLPATLLAKDRAGKFVKVFTTSSFTNEHDIQLADVESISYLMSDEAASDWRLTAEQQRLAQDVRAPPTLPHRSNTSVKCCIHQQHPMITHYLL